MEPEKTVAEDKKLVRRKEVKEEVPVDSKRDKGLGLDVGTAFIVCGLSKNNEASFKVQRDAFFDVDNNAMSKGMLNRLKANYIESEDKRSLYVIGEEALNMANFFNKEVRRPLSQGVISTREKEALSMIKTILHSLVGNPIVEKEVIHYSVPAIPLDANYNIVYHDNMLKSFLTSYGFNAIPMNEALAICWAELDEENYTGISLSFGAGMVNCALSFLGQSEESQQFSVARAGDWIDENAAIAIGLKASKITTLKESGIDLKNPQGREQEAIRIYYENLIKYVCNALEKKINKSENLPNFPEPITVVVSGGSAKAKGFEILFEEELKTRKFPFKIKQVKKAKDQLNAVAKGCLLNSLHHYN
jgi:hypothetical protein